MVQFPGVRAAGKKSIEIDFYYQGQRCRERIKQIPNAANLRLANRLREDILLAIENDTFDYLVTFPGSKRSKAIEKENHVVNVGEWLDKWLDTKEPHIKASTYDGYRKAINALKKSMGKLDLVSIKRRDVREFCDKQTSRNKTIGNIVSVLRDALQLAVDDELIETNPIHDFTYKRNEEPSDYEPDPFSSDEQAAILSVLTSQHHNLIKFAIWSGLRTSELIAIEWGDVDFIRGVIRVQRAKTAIARKAESTKTVAGKRDVKLLPPALSALTDQKQHTFLEGQQIFKNPNTGNPWVGDAQIRKFWGWALKRAGVRYRNPYQTRHTYASMMLSADESIAWLSQQMGHSSPTITMKRYARFIKDSLPNAGNKAVEMFSEILTKNLTKCEQK